MMVLDDAHEIRAAAAESPRGGFLSRFSPQTISSARGFFSAHGEASEYAVWGDFGATLENMDQLSQKLEDPGAGGSLRDESAALFLAHDDMSSDCCGTSGCLSYHATATAFADLSRLAYSVSALCAEPVQESLRDGLRRLFAVISEEPWGAFSAVSALMRHCEENIIDREEVPGHLHSLCDILETVPPADREGIPAEVLVRMSVLR